jgi:hypothetical protein
VCDCITMMIHVWLLLLAATKLHPTHLFFWDGWHQGLSL